jgi:polysaccharide biosynthesis protein PslG
MAISVSLLSARLSSIISFVSKLTAFLHHLSGPGVRVLLIVILFTWPAAARPLLVLGPPQAVVTQHPILCVHTRLTDEVEPWKMLRSLEMVRQMGATTIVEYFPWAYMENEKGQYGWTHADQIVDYARNQGLAVVARLGMVPAWARQRADHAVTTDTYLAPEHYADFGDFVSAFVAHFRGRVQAIIIWNEPNVTLEWGFRPPDPESYTELLKVAYMRAKAADPSLLVLGGALAPTLEPEGSEVAMNDLVYLERMYRAGAGRYFDVLAAHAYGLTYAYDEPPAADVLDFRRVELVRGVMVKYGDAAKRVMLTESGWNDSPRWTMAVKPAARIANTLGGYAWAEQQWPWMLNVCTWAFRLPAPQHSYGDYFTFVSPEFQPKLIYDAVQAWATH